MQLGEVSLFTLNMHKMQKSVVVHCVSYTFMICMNILFLLNKSHHKNIHDSQTQAIFNWIQWGYWIIAVRSKARESRLREREHTDISQRDVCAFARYIKPQISSYSDLCSTLGPRSHRPIRSEQRVFPPIRTDCVSISDLMWPDI